MSGRKKIIIAAVAVLALISGIAVAFHGQGDAPPIYQPEVVEAEEYIEEYSEAVAEPPPIESVSRDELLDAIYNRIQSTMGGDYITAVEFRDGVLTVGVYLPDYPPGDNMPTTVFVWPSGIISYSLDVERMIYTTPRRYVVQLITLHITSIILADERFDEHWDEIIIDFECVGPLPFDKHDIRHLEGGTGDYPFEFRIFAFRHHHVHGG